MIFLFLSSGLFLGWSLGANDGANVFGTAIGSRMLRFRTAALTCGVFIIIGAVISGAGAAHTLGSLGSVNAIAGSFMVALSAAVTVFWMTRLKMPVSTSQAIVGAIIGWNIYTDSLTDYDSLIKIVLSWVACPILSAVFAIGIFITLRAFLNRVKIHLLRIDTITRIGLLAVGAFGAYSLGANNIANVMGVFIPVSPFRDLNMFGLIPISSTQQLFFIGGLAIAVGVYTYSHKVIATVGKSLLKLSPVAALVVVFSQALVLFLFSSEGLENYLLSHGLPPLPLVPVSSSQAVIGAIIGIGLVKGGKGIRYKVLGEIASGWVTTPIAAGIIAFIALFFLQNVFNQEVSRKTTYVISGSVLEHLEECGIVEARLDELKDRKFENPIKLSTILKRKTDLTETQRELIINTSEIDKTCIDYSRNIHRMDRGWFTDKQIEVLKHLDGKHFDYKWEFVNALEKLTDEWRFKDPSPINKSYNKDLKLKRRYLIEVFRVSEDEVSR